MSRQSKKQQQLQQAQQRERQSQQNESLQEKKKRIAQKYKKQAEEFKKKYMPLVRFAQKHKLKIKTARCGNVRIEYFRTDQMHALLTQNKQKIENDSTLKSIASSWEKDVIYFNRIEHAPKLRYPKQLQKSEQNEKSKFASFKFDTSEPKTWLFPAILFSIIAAVLYPLWPYSLKYVIFIICLCLASFIVAIIIVRLILYVILAIFGVSFWLFPNLFADCTIVESFIPVYTVRKWQKGIFSIIGRLLSLAIIGYYAYHLYIDSSWVYENIQITKTSMHDLHDWGVSKIKGQKNFSQSALTNINDIINQTHIDEEEPVILQGLETENQVQFDQNEQNQVGGQQSL